jgi:hypothetical protein
MPTEKFDRLHKYGSDFRGAFDLDPVMSMCSGQECLENDVVKRLNTPKGSMFWAPDEGWDPFPYINAPVSQTAGAMAREIELELSKEERLASSQVTVQKNDTSLSVLVRCVSTDGTAFSFVAPLADGVVPTFVRGTN